MAATAWTDEETFLLLDLWGDESVQALLEGCTRNRHVYKCIARDLEKEGYKRTWSQCRDKLKKLKKEYKKLKDYHDETGKKRKQWKFYDKVDDIIGSKPATQPEVIIDTSVEGTSSRILSDEEGVGISDDEAIEKETEEEGKENETVTLGNEDDEKENWLKKEMKKHNIPSRKRKHENQTKLDKTLNSVVNVITTAQRESDRMYMALEEKRIRFEENLLEMEDRRLREDKEREERRRREERDFQLKMMMMFQKMSTPFPSQYSYPPSSPYQPPFPSSSPYPPSSPHPPSSPYPSSLSFYPPSSPFPPPLWPEATSDQDN